MEKETKEDRKYAIIATRILEEKDFKKIPDGIKDLVSYYRNLMSTEEGVARSIVPWVEKTDIYDGYLKHIQGIGPVLSANLIGAVVFALIMMAAFAFVIWDIVSVFAIYHARKKGTIVKRTD